MYDGLHFELDEKKYQLGKTLGTGSYGVVVKALDRTTRQNVAVKQIPNLYDEHDATKKTMREIRVLQSLRACDYIMTLLDVELSGTSVYIITELCDTDLCALIQNDYLMAKLKPQKYLTIMWELLYAVSFMHSIDILHRDIKPSNILLDSNLTVKLCDFGLARVSHNSETFSDAAAKEMTEYVVSRWYRAPEVVLVPGRYGKKQDVWSCACSIAELVIRKPLFPGTSVVNQVHVIIDILGKPRPDDINFQMSDRSHRYMSSIQSAQTGLDTVLKAASDAISSSLYSLLENMLLFDPRRRPACIDAMTHVVFSSLHQRQQNIAELTKDIKIDLDSIDQCDIEATSLVNMMGSVVLDVRQHLRRLRTLHPPVYGDNKPADTQVRRLSVAEMGSIMAAAVMSGVAAEVDPFSRTVTTVTTLVPVEPPPATATVDLPQRPGIVQRVIQRRRSVMVSREDFSADEPATTTAVAPTKELKKINKSFSKDCLTIDFKKQNFHAPSFNPPAFKPPPSLNPHPPESLPVLKKSVRPHPTKVANRKPAVQAPANPARPVSKSATAQSSKTPPPKTPPPKTPPPKTPPQGESQTTTPKKDGPKTTPKSALWRKASQIPLPMSTGSTSKVFNNPKTPTMTTDSSKASLHESDSRAKLKKKP